MELRRLARLSIPLLVALPALLLLLGFLHYYWDFVSDDAFISFRYAEHLATGRGLEWNPGERVEGYTNFLWVVGLGVLRLLGLEVPAAARLLAWLAAAGSVLLIVVVARRERPQPSRLLLALAPLPLALSFPYQYWTALRLETALFGFLLLLSVALFSIEEEPGRRRRWGSALAYLALALTRPEGALFIAIPGLYLLWRARSASRFRQVLSERWLWLVIFFGGMLLYVGWRLLYFGELLPNTYHAKVGGEGDLRRGWEYLTRFVEHRPHTFMLLLGTLLLGGLASRMGALLLATALLLAAAVVLEGGDWMREFRLLVPSTPLLAAAFAVSLQRIEPARLLRAAGAAGVGLLCLFTQGSAGTPLEEWPAVLAGQRRDLLINLEGELTVASRRAGEWLRRQARAGDLIAVNHAGAVPFYAGLPTLDMAGLNDRHIARLPGPRHGKWDPGYVLRRDPAFVVLNSRVPPHGGVYVPGYWAGETVLFRHPLFQKRYRAVPGAVWSWRHRSLEARNTPEQALGYIMIFRRQGL